MKELILKYQTPDGITNKKLKKKSKEKDKKKKFNHSHVKI